MMDMHVNGDLAPTFWMVALEASERVLRVTRCRRTVMLFLTRMNSRPVRAMTVRTCSATLRKHEGRPVHGGRASVH